MSKYNETTKVILSELTETLGNIKEEEVIALTEKILDARKVFFVGVGRVLLALEAIAKRWAHLGIDTVVVGQITEPAITPEDVLIVGSGSGSSIVPLSLAKKGKSLGATVVHIGSNLSSPMKEVRDLMVRIPVRTKLNLADEIDSKQPMTSLFEQSLLLLGDTIALMIVEEKEIEIHDLWEFHANLE